MGTYLCISVCWSDCVCVNDAHMQHIITYESVCRRPPPLKFESCAEISESGQGESYNIFGICATTSQITATYQKIQKQPPLVGLNMFWDLMSPGKPNNKPQHYHFWLMIVGLSDPLIRWSADPLIRWSAGPLVRWSADPLIRWSADPLIR